MIHIEGLLKVVSGPLGIFILSLVSNSIPFIAVPYLAILVSYAALIPGIYDKVILAVASAAGAALGKVVIYFIGYSVRIGLSERNLKNLELFNKIASRSMFIAIAVFAATPLPDDILYIPLGLAKYNIVLYFLAILLGKTILTAMAVIYTHSVAVFAGEFHLLIPTLIILTAFFSYIIIRVDWSSVIESFVSKGIYGGLKNLLMQVANVLKLSYIIRRLRVLG